MATEKELTYTAEDLRHAQPPTFTWTGDTVAQRVREIEQPRGGYLPLRDFVSRQVGKSGMSALDDTDELAPMTAGKAAVGLAMFLCGMKLEDCFTIAFLGALSYEEHYQCGEKLKIAALITDIRKSSAREGLKASSINAAVQLVCYEKYYRRPVGEYEPYTGAQVSDATMKNMSVIVSRLVSVIRNFKIDAFAELDGGYTDTIVKGGENCFLSKDTIWNFCFGKQPPNKNATLSLLLSLLIGKRSGNEGFAGVRRLAFYNARLDKIWMYDLNYMDRETLAFIATEVLGC